MTGVRAGLLAVLLVCVVPWVSIGQPIRDHGPVTNVAESRGWVVSTNEQGEPFMIAAIQDYHNRRPRNSLLVINLQTGDFAQYFYQDGDRYPGDLFAMLLARSGKFYTMFGDVFLEFDPALRDWTYAERVGGLGMSFAQGPTGLVYAATYPDTNLVEFDPVSGTLTHHGRLHPTEQYPHYLAVDETGWVYAGIGTARSDLVAYHPVTRTLKSLATSEERGVGTGEVYLGVDGKVYGRLPGSDQWYELSGGERHPVSRPAARDEANGLRWGSGGSPSPRELSNGRQIASFSLLTRRVVTALSGRSHEIINFDYETSGQQITSLVTGPDGRIYGSTAHPMFLFAHDPRVNETETFGVIERIGGGNISGFTVYDRYVVGGAYNGGFLYAFDTTVPWAPQSLVNPNPRFLEQYAQVVARPRTLISYPDSPYILMGGFADYGFVGGGLVVYNLETDEDRVLTSDELLPGHSIITMSVLPDGNIVAGTSVEAPGGGRTVAQEAKLLILEWPSLNVIFETEAAPGQTVFGRTIGGAREVFALEVGPTGHVYGITYDSQFFVFDPDRREFVFRATLAGHGYPLRPDQALFIGPDRNVYALLSKGLVTFDRNTFAPKTLVTLPEPATAGLALSEDRVYYASGSHLWSLALPDGLSESMSL